MNDRGYPVDKDFERGRLDHIHGASMVVENFERTTRYFGPRSR